MMKGTKRKIPIEKRETKQQRSLACIRRRKTVFSKAANLCLLSGANIAFFVTSPAESSDVVYSFSGYSPAYEIADCYLNGKTPPKINNPQPKLGFWWENPDLYRNCDDLTELNIIEDRLEKLKDDITALIEKRTKVQVVSNLDQNHTTCSGSPSQFVADLDQTPNFSSRSFSQIASFDQNSYSSLDQISSSQVATFDQNPSFSVEEIQGGFLSSSDQPCCLENNSMSLTQETQTEPMVNVGDDVDESFWENLLL